MVTHQEFVLLGLYRIPPIQQSSNLQDYATNGLADYSTYISCSHFVGHAKKKPGLWLNKVQLRKEHSLRHIKKGERTSPPVLLLRNKPFSGEGRKHLTTNPSPEKKPFSGEGRKNLNAIWAGNVVRAACIPGRQACAAAGRALPGAPGSPPR